MVVNSFGISVVQSVSSLRKSVLFQESIPVLSVFVFVLKTLFKPLTKVLQYPSGIFCLRVSADLSDPGCLLVWHFFRNFCHSSAFSYERMLRYYNKEGLFLSFFEVNKFASKFKICCLKFSTSVLAASKRLQQLATENTIRPFYILVSLLPVYNFMILILDQNHFLFAWTSW